MITVSFGDDIKKAARMLDDVQKKRLPVAMQRALITTAKAIKEAEIGEMRRVFDRPTRWTLGAIKVGPLDSFGIAVGILDPDGYYRRADFYLGTQMSGGIRRNKAFERALQRAGVMPVRWFAVPGAKAKLDQYGNMGPGEIKQIMSWFSAATPFAGSTQNMTAATRDKRRKGTKTKRGFEYLAVMPGATAYRGLRPGIYRRTSFVFGKAIEPILIYVPNAKYRKRFSFESVARTTADKVFWPNLRSAINRDVIGA